MIIYFICTGPFFNPEVTCENFCRLPLLATSVTANRMTFMVGQRTLHDCSLFTLFTFLYDWRNDTLWSKKKNIFPVIFLFKFFYYLICVSLSLSSSSSLACIAFSPFHVSCLWFLCAARSRLKITVIRAPHLNVQCVWQARLELVPSSPSEQTACVCPLTVQAGSLSCCSLCVNWMARCGRHIETRCVEGRQCRHAESVKESGDVHWKTLCTTCNGKRGISVAKQNKDLSTRSCWTAPSD